MVEIFGDDYIRTKKRLMMKENANGAELQKHHAFDDVDREILPDSDKDERTVTKKQFVNISSREEALNQSFALTQSEKTAIIENLGKTFVDVCDNDAVAPIDKSRESRDMDIEENDNDLCSGFVRNEIGDDKDHKQDEVRFSVNVKTSSHEMIKFNNFLLSLYSFIFNRKNLRTCRKEKTSCFHRF